MRIILSVAKGSEQLTPEVRQWATSEFYSDIWDTDRSRAVVRAFWAENAAHFAAKNYQAVRPSGAQLGQSPALQPVVNKSNSAPPLPAAARPPAKRVTVGTGSNAVTSAQVASASRTPAVAPAAPVPPAPLWPWLLLAVNSLGGWLWWRSR